MREHIENGQYNTLLRLLLWRYHKIKTIRDKTERRNAYDDYADAINGARRQLQEIGQPADRIVVTPDINYPEYYTICERTPRTRQRRLTMKTIKHILVFVIIVLAALSFTACGDSAEIESKTPLDVRYTPQHQELVTDYEYKYNWWTGDFELVPNMHTETIPDKYEVLYHIEYTDGSTADKWKTVNKAEYDTAAVLCGGGQ